MKTLQKIALLAVLFSGSLLSCSKHQNENDFDPSDAFYETYTGVLGAGVETPENYLQLKLEDHGSLLTINANKALPGLGNWEVEGNNFSGSFRYNADNVKITLAGSLDDKENIITGTWGYGENKTGGGSFVVVKEKRRLAIAETKDEPGHFLMARYLL